MNNIEELREHCEEMIAISRMQYAYIPASSIITLIDRIEKAEAALSAANEKLSKPVVLPEVVVVNISGKYPIEVMYASKVKTFIKAAGFTVEGE
ncbi:hypothetical protein [Yersinia enterocolitica]|uniref:hypothetical protein n=1 Tax=Yersinia enterocolitica TaxID=630 RepID=UPI00297B3789|nr:hypothetical protein [Yersinia enterocolitica]EKN5164356.1 hypothetical protein [Yersinia enterocolitica]EKN6076429.1 hypothetical protein [Yersinia enterocolitica]EKN6096833.1 hypothetical protein [Yersinia enterocolitica]HDL7891919.1 hypothetical protein [Yersinia enterocolitica]